MKESLGALVGIWIVNSFILTIIFSMVVFKLIMGVW